MRYPIISVIILLALSFACISAHALIALEPGKDYQMVKKELTNDDGTKAVIEEPALIRPFPEIPAAEVSPPPENRVEKKTIAKGWQTKAGLYKPQQPMFSVTHREPENWPIPKKITRAVASTTTKPADNQTSYGWIITTLSLGIIGFAGFRLYLHFKDEPDINKA